MVGERGVRGPLDVGLPASEEEFRLYSSISCCTIWSPACISSGFSISLLLSAAVRGMDALQGVEVGIMHY